jgi:hypothetical protein
VTLAFMVFAATWSFAAWGVGALLVGFVVGWLVHGVWETGEDAMAAHREFKAKAIAAYERLGTPQRADTPVQRETTKAR